MQSSEKISIETNKPQPKRIRNYYESRTLRRFVQGSADCLTTVLLALYSSNEKTTIYTNTKEQQVIHRL